MTTRIGADSFTPDETQRIAENIYIYGYPVLLMDMRRRIFTAAPYPSFRSAPVNQFAHTRFLPAPYDKSILPEPECLRPCAWLDLGREPVIVTVPRTPRYHLFSFYSAWYEIFESISPRSTEMQGVHLGLVGPRWSGRLPNGVKRLHSPTETVWLDGSIAIDGVEDLDRAHSVQDQFLLTPMSDWGKPPMRHSFPFRPDIDQKATPQEQIDELDARAFYTRLSQLIAKNPPQSSDIDVVAEFAHVGFFPGEEFVYDMLPPQTLQAMQSAVPAAQSKIVAGASNHRGSTVNNWLIHTHPGSFRTEYLNRAVEARTHMATALPEDAIWCHTSVDQAGKPLRGANRYEIHFPGNTTPPVNAFWSITLYDSRHRLVSNNIHRYAISNRDRLRLNPDSSLSIYIQRDWPGADRDCNWLPAPAEEFNLAIRMYWPKPEVFAADWQPPAVTPRN